MSQHDFTIANQGMPAARADINAALQALASTNKGPSAPATPYTGELWIDDAASPWTLKLYDGTDWIAVGTINPTTNLFQATNHARTDQTVNMTAAINEAGWVDLASAATCNIGAAASNNVRITGSTTITSFGTAASGVRRILRFAGALTLTHNATSLILPGNTNLATAANDTATFVSLGSGNWLCAGYKRASGLAVVGASGSTLTAGTPLVMNPFATSTTATQAHGLGAEPKYIEVVVECVSAELNWSVGDRIRLFSDSYSGNNWNIWANSTNLEIITSNSGLVAVNKSTRVSSNLTSGNWKLVATPYKIG
ncbi:MAG: hypothetical protein AB7P52_11595 [Alphaproteobacteria bacterium]